MLLICPTQQKRNHLRSVVTNELHANGYPPALLKAYTLKFLTRECFYSRRIISVFQKQLRLHCTFSCFFSLSSLTKAGSYR